MMNSRIAWQRLSKLRIVFAVLVSIGMMTTAHAVAPILYKNPFRQSPVRAEPGDLLMIAGSGFAAGDRVAYKLVTDTTNVPSHPPFIISPNTAASGEATVVANATDALTIQLPAVMTVNQSYVFWVKNAAGDWSSGVLINDARPLWITPEKAFATQTFGGLPRRLKVVGRNLQPFTGGKTHVRLKKVGTGKPVTYDLIADDDDNAATAIERYAAIVTLPGTMTPATYSVEVNRDGTSWVLLSGQNLVVGVDPEPQFEFSPGTRCPDGMEPPCDDTAAVAAAITAAANIGGGTVVLGPGAWKLGASGSPAPDPIHGLVLPIGVSIRGVANQTTVERGGNWNAQALFTLMGSNEVKNIKFKDAVYHPLSDKAHREQSFLMIGPRSSGASWGDPTVVDTVMIHDNTFDNGINGLREGGFPIRHLYVVNNTFGAWYDGIFFAGPSYSETNRARFNLENSVITGNTFKPGGYDDPAIGQGSIASEIGASYNLDFSDNNANGHATDYIYGSNPGFRAGFFFHMSNNHERVLFSRNLASCTGDRAGDGEFMSYDNNINTFGFSSTVNAIVSTPTSVTVAGSMQVGTPADYFANHWVQIVSGPGIGQARKISSYTLNGSLVTINVTPAWEMQPTSSSVLTVSREVWQSYVVDNIVDNTGCTLNSNPPEVTRPESGEISFWATSADSAIEGNVQTGTDGIILQANYSVPTDFVDQNIKQFLEIRGNTIAGEVNYDSFCSWSGIAINYGCSDEAPAPVLSYGLSISHNAIDHSDSLRGGAIVVEDGSSTSQSGHPMVVNTLIYDNAITNLGNDPPTDGSGLCDSVWAHRRGIHLHKYEYNNATHAIARTVLVGNTFPSGLVCQFLDDTMTNTVNLDTPPAGGWCPVP